MDKRKYQMTHEIKNQHDKHIMDELIRDEINYALEHGLFETYFNDKRIDIVSDKKSDDGRVTLVEIKGL